MRLWSLHPSLLDRAGLAALWRESLLAQKVLLGRTKGYRFHPQLYRFRQAERPVTAIADYLREVQAEATRRGYLFDASKIAGKPGAAPLSVTRGQLLYEWKHLESKLRKRDPAWLQECPKKVRIRAHPLFNVIPGRVEPWERR